MTDANDTPVIVKGSAKAALPTFVTTALRYLATALLGSTMGKPVVDFLAANGVVLTVDAVYSMLAVAAITGWGLWDTHVGKQKQKELASMLPDSKAQVR